MCVYGVLVINDMKGRNNRESDLCCFRRAFVVFVYVHKWGIHDKKSKQNDAFILEFYWSVKKSTLLVSFQHIEKKYNGSRFNVGCEEGWNPFKTFIWVGAEKQTKLLFDLMFSDIFTLIPWRHAPQQVVSWIHIFIIYLCHLNMNSRWNGL